MNKNEVEKIVEIISNQVRNQLNELQSFDIKNSTFIEFELDICNKINIIGATILEKMIPFVYGNGYVGPNLIREEDEFSCIVKSRKRMLTSVFGKITIDRAVYSESWSGSSKAFLDEKLKIEGKRISPLLEYWGNLMSTVTSFNEASDILNKIRGVKISKTYLENSTEFLGEKISEMHEDEVKNIVLSKKNELPTSEINLSDDAKRVVYLETDGCHINTTYSWKECKTFMLFETEKKGEKVELRNKYYFSTMRNVNNMKRHLKYHLEKYCGDEQVKLVCIGDGAKWIWNILSELFPEDEAPIQPIKILDWSHSIEKIGDIKREVFSDENRGNIFYDKCKEFLWDGNTDLVISELEILKNIQKLQTNKTFVDEILKYFLNNEDKMKYDKYRKEGLCIGSGAIESANKYVVQRRLKQAGMKWTEENANSMAHLRAMYINGDLERFCGINDNALLNSVIT